jgi:hypothetical protein
LRGDSGDLCEELEKASGNPAPAGEEIRKMISGKTKRAFPSTIHRTN